MNHYSKQTIDTKVEFVKLVRLLKKQPQYGANEEGRERKSKEEPRYIRITDIDENGFIVSDELGMTANTIEEQYLLNEDDIIIARSGNTVGKSYIHKASVVKYPCFFAGYMIRFIVDESKVSPDYVFLVTQLDFYKKWVSAIQRPTGQPNINAEEYKSFKIPLPQSDIQNQAIRLFTEAQQNKQKLEKQASELLAGIDEYLLQELGINLPVEETSQRVFYTSLRAVSGGRFDPQFYHPVYQRITEAIQAQPNMRLGDIVTFSNEVWDQKTLHPDTFPYIEISEINTFTGTIHDVSNLNTNEAPSRAKMLVRTNDILVSTTRPNRGAITLIDETKDAHIASTGFAVLRTIKTDSIVREYLFEILRSSILLKQFEQRSSGGNYPAITSDELRKTLVPLPDTEKQKRIITYIRAVRTQAQALRHQAYEQLQRAKAEVEKMILGNNNT